MTESQTPEKCNICLDKFTGVVRACVKCPYCPSSTCKICLQQYLLNLQEDPQCMGCKREWNREFLDMHLPATFRKGAFRLQRRKVLMDREMSMLPSMQVYVEATVHRDKAWNLYKKSQTIIDNLTSLRVKEEQKAYLGGTVRTTDLAIPAAVEESIQKVGEYAKQISEETIRSRIYHGMYYNYVGILEGRDTKNVQVRQFIMKCPGTAENQEPCRGFLSTQWKCGTCQKFYCSDCHALLGDTREVPHTCNEDAKATAAMIRKETRPCPKCGIRISKIDGCDQMWCTSCQTAFSWNSGQILHNARIHNPHYYEYLRQSGRTMPREAGDIPCGGIPDYYVFARTINRLRMITQREIDCLYRIHRSLLDISEVRLPEHPLRRPANDNRDLDVAYLIGTINKEEWARNLELKETKFERKRDIGMILQTLVHVGAEKLTEISNIAQLSVNTHPATVAPGEYNLPASLIRERMRELEGLRDFTNAALKKRGEQMGIVVPQITGENWTWGYTKRKTKTPVPTPGTTTPTAETPTAQTAPA